jgi:hypothetical protein
LLRDCQTLESTRACFINRYGLRKDTYG